MKKLILLISVLAFAISPLFSQQQVLTYENVVNIAVEQSIVIKLQKNQLKVNQAVKQQSMASFLPNLSASGWGYRTDGQQWSNEESAMVNTSIDRASYNIGNHVRFG